MHTVTGKRYTDPLLSLLWRHPDVKSSKIKGSYPLQSSASASWGKKLSVVGMEWVPQESDLEAVVPLLMCWTVAAAGGLSWMECRVVLLWHCWSLLRPQESKCQPAHSVPGHGAHCFSGCHPYSTPGWSHCGHHSPKNWWWWLRGDGNREGIRASEGGKIRERAKTCESNVLYLQRQSAYTNENCKDWIKNVFTEPRLFECLLLVSRFINSKVQYHTVSNIIQCEERPDVNSHFNK